MEPAPDSSFSDLVSQPLSEALAVQGIHSPNAIQASALQLTLSGRDVSVVAQTGAGKTLTFILPMLARLSRASNTRTSVNCEALVVSPTHELSLQHERVARALGYDNGNQLLCLTLDQLLSDSPDLSGLQMVALDEVDALLFGAPEDNAVSPAGVQLLRMLAPTAPQLMLTTAYLSRAHERKMLEIFPEMFWCKQGTTESGPGVLVPDLRLPRISSACYVCGV